MVLAMTKRFVLLWLTILSCLQAGDFKAYIGPQFNYIRYEEENKDKIDGYMVGVSAAFDYSTCGLRAGLRFNGVWDTNYLRGDPCSKCSASEYLLSGRVGSDIFCLCNQYPVFLYTGFGWHRFEITHFPESISLRYRCDKLFIPLGISFCFPYSLGGNIGLNLEWRPDVYSNLKQGSNSYDNKCDHGFRVEIPFTWCCHTSCGQVLSRFSPFFDCARFGKFEDGEEVMFVVPSSKRWELGLSWIVGFNF